MSAPPPGHDPTQSLLQGGSATITPLMGGGGDMANGNSQESLLTGGTSVPITPLQGGSRPVRRRSKSRSRSRSKSRSRSRSKSRSKRQSKQTGGAYQNVRENEQPIPPNTNPLKDVSSSFKNNVVKYRVKAHNMWVRSYKGSVNKASPIIPMQSQCLHLKTGQQMTMYDRLAIILSPKIRGITIFPPIKGDENLLQSCLEYIRNNDNENAVFVFSPGVFAPSSPANDKKIMASLLEIQTDTNIKSSVFLLSQNTVEEAKRGCKLTTGDTDSMAIVNLLGPTYIIFPSESNLESSHEVIGGVIITGSTVQEPNIPACKLANVTRGVKDFISYKGISRDTLYTSVSFLPNINSPETLISSYPFKVYNLQETNSNFTFVDNKTTMIRFNVIEDNSNMGGFTFTPDSKLAIQGVEKKKVWGNGIAFLIRDPVPDVIKDWVNGRWTEQELAYMRLLEIDDEAMLEEIFDAEWPEELADFLSDVSKFCGTEIQQTMDIKCDGVRDFLDKISIYRAVNGAVINPLLFNNNENETSAAEVELREKIEALEAQVKPPDGTITSPDGTITSPDGTITTPDGTKISPAKTVTADGKIKSTGKIITSPDGTVISPGGTVKPRRKSSAKASSPDETVTSPDETVTSPDETVTSGDGTETSPDGTVTSPDVPATYGDGTETYLDETVTYPDETVPYGDQTVIYPDESVTYPDETAKPSRKPTKSSDGTITYPDGTVKYPDGTVKSRSKPTKSSDGTITYPDGTVKSPDGTVTPRGKTTKLPGKSFSGRIITSPDGTITTSDGTTISPDGIVTSPSGIITTPGRITKASVISKLSKSPFDGKYFKAPHPAIENLWDLPLKKVDPVLQGETSKIGVPYLKDVDGLPNDMSLHCEIIRVMQFDKDNGEFIMTNAKQYSSELCAIVPTESTIDQRDTILLTLFNDVQRNFPGWFFSYLG